MASSPPASSAGDISPVPEEPEQMSLQDAATKFLALHNSHSQEVASCFVTRTTGAQRGSQMVAQLLGKGKAVSNWAKATLALVPEDKKEPLMALVKYVEDLEIENVQALQQVSRVSHRCKELMAVMGTTFGKVQQIFAVPGFQGSGGILLDQYDSKLIERELGHVEALSKAIKDSYADLESLGSKSTSALSLRTIQEVERTIFATDSLKDVQTQIGAIQGHRNVRETVVQKRAVEKGFVKVLMATLDEAKDKLEGMTSVVEHLKARMKEVVEHKKRLESASSLNMEESMEEVKRIQAKSEGQMKKLECQLRAIQEQKKSNVDKIAAEHEQQIRAVETELTDNEGSPANHFVFGLDRSFSMSGVRFTAAIDAIESFKTVRVQEGSQDMVSCVAFDDRATTVVANQPIASDWVSALKVHGPRGGTSYAPAWDLVAKCARDGPIGYKLVVVFITDGFASDIPLAATLAARLHQDFASRGGMNSFIVNVDNAVENALLKPLVLAGNGGQEILRVFGETSQLLVNVTSSYMIREFKILASLANLREVSLKRRMALLRALQRDNHVEAEASIKQLEVDFANRLKRLEVAKKKARTASNNDAEAVKQLLDKQLEELRKEENDLSTAILGRSAEMRKWEGIVGHLEVQVSEKEKEILKSEEGHQRQLEILSKNIDTEVQALEGVHVSQEVLQQASGTTDVKTLKQRIDELQDLRRLCTANLMYTTDQAEMVGTLNRFLDRVVDSVRNPLGSLEATVAMKADFVFALLLEERGLAVTGPMSSHGLPAVLEYEARNLGLDEDATKQAVDLIQSSGITAEDFCEICSRNPDKDQVDAKKISLVQEVEKKAFEAAEVGDNCSMAQEIKALNAVMVRTKKEHDELVAKAKKDPDDDFLAADTEAKKDELEALKTEIAEKRKELNEAQAEVRKDQAVTLQLVRLMVQHCKAAYIKKMATFELQTLRTNFHLYHQNVHQPMGDLVQMVDDVKRAYCTPQLSSAAADVDSVSSGLRASASRGYTQQQLAAAQSDMP